MLPLRAIVLSLLAVVVAACSSESVSTPGSLPGGIVVPKDSTPGSFYAGVTDITGRVVLHAPSTTNADSVISAPDGSASIRLNRNDKVDGSGAYSYVTELTTGANGNFVFRGLPAGFYRLTTTVRLGTWTGFQTTYIPANTASVSTDIHVYR